VALLNVIFNVLFPVFALVAIGYAAGRKLQLDARTLSRFSYFILTPAFVFGYMSQASVGVGEAARMIGFVSAVYLGSTLIAYVTARLLKRDPRMTAAYVMLAVFGNVGNYGLPITKFSQGEAALVPGAIYFLANLVLAFVVCVWAANAQGSKWRAALSVLKTPALIALVPAVVFNAFDLQPPLALSRPIELLSGALIPTMLVTLGAQLAANGLPKPDSDMLIATAIRLLSGPILAFGLVGLFGIEGLARNVGIIQSSMPTAVLVSLIALEYKVLPSFVTATVLLSNVLSVATLAVVLTLL
jgi:malate permease and related proteins